MTAVDIIQDLRRRGVELRAEGDRLQFRPKEAITPALMQALKQHKAEVIAALTAPPVQARVRGQDAVTEAASAEPCFHCKSSGSCDCALCAVAATGTGWGEGPCRACLGSGYLTWPGRLQ